MLIRSFCCCYGFVVEHWPQLRELRRLTPFHFCGMIMAS